MGRDVNEVARMGIAYNLFHVCKFSRIDCEAGHIRCRNKVRMRVLRVRLFQILQVIHLNLQYFSNSKRVKLTYCWQKWQYLFHA